VGTSLYSDVYNCASFGLSDFSAGLKGDVISSVRDLMKIGNAWNIHVFSSWAAPLIECIGLFSARCAAVPSTVPLSYVELIKLLDVKVKIVEPDVRTGYMSVSSLEDSDVSDCDVIIGDCVFSVIPEWREIADFCYHQGKKFVVRGSTVFGSSGIVCNADAVIFDFYSPPLSFVGNFGILVTKHDFGSLHSLNRSVSVHEERLLLQFFSFYLQEIDKVSDILSYYKKRLGYFFPDLHVFDAVYPLVPLMLRSSRFKDVLCDMLARRDIGFYNPFFSCSSLLVDFTGRCVCLPAHGGVSRDAVDVVYDVVCKI